MASMNSDIRVKNRSQVRVAAIIVSLAIGVLSLTFAISFLPSFASAHTSTFDPAIVEENGQVYVQVEANLAPGDHVDGVLAGWSSDSLQCYPISPAAVNDTDGSITTDFGQIEFMMTAPDHLQDGGYQLFYQVTGSADCQTLKGTLLTTDDVLDVIASEAAHTSVSKNFIVTASNMQGWSFADDEHGAPGTGALVFGPGTAPLGQGSALLTATSSTDGQALKLAALAGLKLSTITSLSYSSFQDASNTSNQIAPALQFDVVHDTATWAGGYEGRAVFEPTFNVSGGIVPQGSWNNWDAINGGSAEWWLTGADDYFGGNCSHASPCTLSQLISLYPNVGTHPDYSEVLFKAGSGWPPFSGNVDNFSVTVDDGANATTTTYDFEPTEPNCAQGQHPENHVCVADTTGGGNPGSSSSDNTSSGNSGGNGPIVGSFGVVNSNPTNGGIVLGTSTEELPAGCSIYLNSYLKLGAKNDAGEVTKLQTFLNGYMQAGLPVTGVFGPLTYKAVQAFQLKHWDDVLAPWVPFGLSNDHQPTGYVYKTTRYKINLLQCATLSLPKPQLP